MALRPCLGCGRLVSGSRCGTCQPAQPGTSARGYGGPHQAERKRRLAVYQPGDPCAEGGEPLPYPVAIAARYLDLPHDHANGGYLPGLSCRTHNRSEGATRGNRMRGNRMRRKSWTTSRNW